MGYEPTKKEIADLKKFTNSLLKRETEKAEILSSEIYQNAFEWRFEFPETLDENGTFIGFDVVIGNPPYTKSPFIKHLRFALKKTFQIYQSSADLYIYFFELSQKLSQKNGVIHLITPNNWLNTKSANSLRHLIAQKEFVKILDYEKQNIFTDFSTTSVITQFSKQELAEARDFSTIEIEKVLTK
jgi:adenine-specific DNA-methyltransferase